jgi:hypothetical protein
MKCLIATPDASNSAPRLFIEARTLLPLSSILVMSFKSTMHLRFLSDRHSASQRERNSPDQGSTNSPCRTNLSSSAISLTPIRNISVKTERDSLPRARFRPILNFWYMRCKQYNLNDLGVEVSNRQKRRQLYVPMHWHSANRLAHAKQSPDSLEDFTVWRRRRFARSLVFGSGIGG